MRFPRRLALTYSQKSLEGLRHSLPMVRSHLTRSSGSDRLRAFPRWLAVVLHWRQPPRAPAAMRQGGVTNQHFHLKTTTARTDVQVFPAMLRERTATHAHITKEITLGLDQGRPQPVRGALDFAPALKRTQGSKASREPSRLPVIPPIARPQQIMAAPWIAPRPSGEPVDAQRMRRGPAVMMRGVGADPILSVPSALRSAQGLDLSTPHVEPRDHPSCLPTLMPAHQVAALRATHAQHMAAVPELVWRKSGPAVKETEIGVGLAQRLSHAAAIAGVGSRPDAAELPAPVATAPRRPTVLSDLDPGLIDRLADDVIRRVERRSRIERERRGL